MRKKYLIIKPLFKQDENHAENDTSKRPNDLIDDSKDKKAKQDKEDNKDCKL